MNQNSKNPKSSLSRSPHTLRMLLVRAAEDAVGDAPVSLEIDIPADADFAGDATRLADLVGAMVRGALDSLPSGGEIMVTYWQDAAGWELEVADNGPAIETRPHRLPMVAAALGAELVWQNCPQGGAAVTARLRRTHTRREAA